jgi:hypothetical protein
MTIQAEGYIRTWDNNGLKVMPSTSTKKNCHLYIYQGTTLKCKRRKVSGERRGSKNSKLLIQNLETFSKIFEYIMNIPYYSKNNRTL